MLKADRKLELRSADENKELLQGLNDFAEEAHKNAVAHGWYDKPFDFAHAIAQMSRELSEALDAYDHGAIENEIKFDGEKPMGVPIELADAIIRIIEYSDFKGIDIARAILLKHEYNKTRSYRHGKR